MEERQLRMIFSKSGNIRLISHLDMTRAFLRAFVRAGIKLKMSEGFSPHPRISFPVPLSVGMESENEVLDFSVSAEERRSPDEICKLMKNEFPDGIIIKKVYPAERKSKEIAFAEYDIIAETDRNKDELCDIFSKPVIIKKKTKKGIEKEIEINSGIKKIAFIPLGSEKGKMKVSCILSASGDNYLNPEFIAQNVSEKGFCRIKRISFFDKELNPFE